MALGFGETGSPSRCCRSPAVSSMTSHAALCTSLSSSGKWGDRMFPLGLFHMKTFNLHVLLQVTCTRLHRWSLGMLWGPLRTTARKQRVAVSLLVAGFTFDLRKTQCSEVGCSYDHPTAGVSTVQGGHSQSFLATIWPEGTQLRGPSSSTCRLPPCVTLKRVWESSYVTRFGRG